LQVCKAYCTEHAASICLLCAITDHRKYNDVHSLKKHAKEVDKELASLQDGLTKSSAELDGAAKELDQHGEKRKASTQAALKEVKEVFDELETAVKAGRQRLEGLLNEADTADDVAVTTNKVEVLKRSSVITCHSQLLQRFRGLTSRDDVRQAVPILKERINGLEVGAALSEGSKDVSNVELKLDQDVVTWLKKELSELGQVDVVPASVAANVGK
jgi:septal ring factor EnvC (AmiA/AmiB activator)